MTLNRGGEDARNRLFIISRNGHSLWRGGVFSLLLDSCQDLVAALRQECGRVTVWPLKLDCQVHCGFCLVLVRGTHPGHSCCEEAQTRPFGETVWRGAEAPPTIAVTPSPALMSFSAVPNPVEPSVSLGSAMSS